MFARSATRRPAVTLVESVVIFLVFLTLLLALFDLGTAVFESHILTDTARQVARQASVHGELADALGPWGPAAVGPLPASNAAPACAVASSYLAGVVPSTVTVLVEWPDGGNSVGMRVRVTLTTTYTLIVPQLWNGASIPLQAVSTTIIVH